MKGSVVWGIGFSQAGANNEGGRVRSSDGVWAGSGNFEGVCLGLPLFSFPCLCLFFRYISSTSLSLFGHRVWNLWRGVGGSFCST